MHRVRSDEWTAELAIIASNVHSTITSLFRIPLVARLLHPVVVVVVAVDVRQPVPVLGTDCRTRGRDNPLFGSFGIRPACTTRDSRGHHQYQSGICLKQIIMVNILGSIHTCHLLGVNNYCVNYSLNNGLYCMM